jgi:ABC-type nitrate/sulfonate/bicarbonate transport system substrate-binding protein
MAAPSARKAKPLSLSNITIGGPESASGVVTWTAMFSGIFAKQGLHVTYEPQTGSGSATALAELITGVTQFAETSPSSGFPALVNGAPIRAIEMDETSDGTVLTIANSFAAAHNIRTTGSSSKDALAQLQALKGSHIRVGISTVASRSYQELYAVAVQHGLSVGGPSADIDIVPLGSPTVLVAGLESSKVDAFVNAPPVSSLEAPGAFDVSISAIPPLSKVADNYICVSTGTIDQHPDTVQAVTDAYVLAAKFMAQHQAAAEQSAATGLSNYAGITSPQEAHALFEVALPTNTTRNDPYPNKATFQGYLNVFNETTAKPLALSYSQWVDLRFITVSLKKFPGDFPKNAVRG